MIILFILYAVYNKLFIFYVYISIYPHFTEHAINIIYMKVFDDVFRGPSPKYKSSIVMYDPNP